MELSRLAVVVALLVLLAGCTTPGTTEDTGEPSTDDSDQNLSEMMQDQQEKVRDQLETHMEIVSLSCSTSDGLTMYMRNSGKTAVDGSSVEVTVYDPSTGDEAASRSVDWSDKAFTEPGNVAEVSAAVDGLEAGSIYDVEVTFSSGYTATASCSVR